MSGCAVLGYGRAYVATALQLASLTLSSGFQPGTPIGQPLLVGFVGALVGAGATLLVMWRTLKFAAQQAADAAEGQRELLREQIKADREARRHDRLITNTAVWQRAIAALLGPNGLGPDIAQAQYAVVALVMDLTDSMELWRVCSRATSVAERPDWLEHADAVTQVVIHFVMWAGDVDNRDQWLEKVMAADAELPKLDDPADALSPEGASGT